MVLRSGAPQSGRHHVLLAPGHDTAPQFNHALVDPSRYHRLLGEAQKLRGRVYLQDGAIRLSDLSAGDRHIQVADDQAWHLLTINQKEEVVACIRYFAHPPSVKSSDLAIAGSGIALVPVLGAQIRAAIETELDFARRRGIWYVELGGWAICESIRCTTEAIRTLLTVYALSRIRGGAVGLSSATTRHHSSSILRRIGGRRLKANGMEISAYYDARYACEMELLGFDSDSPNVRYESWISDCQEMLHQVPVVLGAPTNTCASDLVSLQAAIADHSGQIVWQSESTKT